VCLQMVQHAGTGTVKLGASVEKKAQFVCEVCGLAFKHKYSMTRHSVRIHKKHKPMHCPACGVSVNKIRESLMSLKTWESV
jgi:transposase-like protein